MRRISAAPSGQAAQPAGAAPRSPAQGSSIAAGSVSIAGSALVVVVLAGIVLRVAQYLSNRSLWHDETLLALNLVDRTLAEAIRRPLFEQAAPVPFMVGEWLVGQAAGYSEESLRLIPLVAGIAATVLFAILARLVSGPWPAVVATLVFVVSDRLVYYAAELKPYSVDVLVAIGLTLLGALVLGRTPSARRSVAYGVIGGAAILCSFPSVFVASAICVVLLVEALIGRESLASRLPLVGLWIAAVVVLALDAHSRTSGVRSAFDPDGTSEAGRLAYGEGGAVIDVDWLDNFASRLLNAIGTSEGRPASHLLKLMAFAAVLGFAAMATRRRWLAGMLALPFLFTLIASRLELYPLTERTTVFLLPSLALLIADGIAAPARWLRGPAGLVLSGILALGVLAYPVYESASHLVDPRVRHETRPVFEELVARTRPGDTLYLHPRSQYAFRYYADCECAGDDVARLGALFPFERVEGEEVDSQAVRPTNARLIVGGSSTEAANLRRELRSTHGRLWIVHSHVAGSDDEQFVRRTIPRVLDDLGRRIATIRRPGATAYLYELP